MDSDGSNILTGTALVVFIIVIRSFFTACETALTEINDAKVQSFCKSSDKKEQRLYHILKKPLRLMTAFSCVRITTAALTAFTAATYFYAPLSFLLGNISGIEQTDSLFLIVKAVSVLVITILLVILLAVVTDGIPRRIVTYSKIKDSLAVSCSAFISSVITFLLPVTVISEKLIILISSVFGVDRNAERELVTEEDIRMLVDVGNETGVIEENQREMINNIFEFGDRSVSDVMTHRTEITAVESDIGISALVYEAINSGFSRIPVYKGSIDHIVGIIYIKDLLCLVGNDAADTMSAQDFVRDVIYVPETSGCDDLFERMTKEKFQIAVAVDEYGGTAGLVTMEDLVESIVGNIQDEYDNETEEFIEISENEFFISGIAHPEEIMEKLGLTLPENSDFDTMSGFLISLLGRLPENGEMLSTEYMGMQFTALITEDKHISRIKAVRIQTEQTV